MCEVCQCGRYRVKESAATVDMPPNKIKTYVCFVVLYAIICLIGCQNNVCVCCVYARVCELRFCERVELMWLVFEIERTAHVDMETNYGGMRHI